MGQHLAEDANFALKGGYTSSKGPVAEYTVNFTRADLERMAMMMAMSNPEQAGQMAGSETAGGMIEGYSLETDVQKVVALPNGEASAFVTIYESAMIGEGDMTATYSGVGTCQLRLAKPGDAIEIEVTACQMNVSL